MAEPEKKPAPSPAPAATPAAGATAAPAPAPGAAGHATPAKTPGGDHGKAEAAVAPGAEVEATPAPAGSPKILIFIMIGLVAIMPFAALILVKLMIVPQIEKKRADAENADVEVDGEEGKAEAGAKEEKKSAEKPKSEAKKENSHGEEKGGEKLKSNPGGLFIPEIVVNIAGTRGTRFLRATFQFEGPPEALSEMDVHTGEFRDIVSTVLASKRLDQLDVGDVRQRLRSEVMVLVNAALKSDKKITNVYITDFVIQ